MYVKMYVKCLGSPCSLRGRCHPQLLLLGFESRFLQPQRNETVEEAPLLSLQASFPCPQLFCLLVVVSYSLLEAQRISVVIGELLFHPGLDGKEALSTILGHGQSPTVVVP